MKQPFSATQNPKREHSQIPMLFVTVPLHHLKANIQNKELIVS
jgi:hypothetical protein